MKYVLNKNHLITGTLLFLIILSTAFSCITTQGNTPVADSPAGEPIAAKEEKLVVIWSSRDRDVALNMAFMYTLNSARFHWWDDITFVIWGPSAKLLTEDEQLQKGIKQMLDAGITVKACQMCADNYGVSAQLREMGITVKLMGELTDFLKEGRKVLTF